MKEKEEYVRKLVEDLNYYEGVLGKVVLKDGWTHNPSCRIAVNILENLIEKIREKLDDAFDALIEYKSMKKAGLVD